MSQINDGFVDEREEGMISDDDEDTANAKECYESSSGVHSNKDDYRNSHKDRDSKSRDSKTVSKKQLIDRNGSGDEEVEEGQIPASPYKNNGSSKSRSRSRSRSRSASGSRSRSKESSKASRSGSESKSASRSRSRSRSRNRRKRGSRSRSRSRSRRRRSYSRSRSRSGTRSPYSGPIIKDYRRGRRGNFPSFNRFNRGRRPFRRGSFVPHHSYRNKYQTYSKSRSKSGSPKRRFHDREFEKERSRSPPTEEDKSEVLNPADIKKSQKQITQSFLAMLEEKQKKTRMLPLDYPKFEKSHNYSTRQHGFVNTFATVGDQSPKNSLSLELEKEGWQVIDDAEMDSMRHKAYDGEEEGKDKAERKSTEEKNNSSERSRKRRQSMSISGDSETDEDSKLKSLVKPKKKSSDSSSSEDEEPKHKEKEREKEKDKESKKKSKHKKKDKKKKKKRDDSSSSSEEDSKGKRRKSKKKKKHSKKYNDSDSEEDEEQDENAEASGGHERGDDDGDVEMEDDSSKKEKSKKRKRRSKSESSSESDSEERSRKKKSKKKRKKRKSKRRRRDSSSSTSSEDDSDSSDSESDKKKKSKKRKKKSKKAKKTKKSKKETVEKAKKKSEKSSKKKKGEEKPSETKEKVNNEESNFVWPTAMICYTQTKPSLQYCVNPKYMCESKVEHSKDVPPNTENLASEYERFLNEVNPNAANDDSISLEAQLREKLLKQMHNKGDANEKSDYLTPSEKRTMEKMKKEQQKQQEKEESLKRQESLKSAPLNTYYSTKKTASDAVVDMDTSDSPKDDGENKEPFNKSEKDIKISFSESKDKKDADKKADVEDERKQTAKELLDKIKKKKDNEKVIDPSKNPIRKFGNLPVIGKRPTKKKDNNETTPEQLISNMNADYNYYVHYYISTYGLDAYSAAYYAQYVMLTNGEYAYADTTLWMKSQGYVLTDVSQQQQQLMQPEQPQVPAVQPAAPVNTPPQMGDANAQGDQVNANESEMNENNECKIKNEVNDAKEIKSEVKSETTDKESKCENDALTGNKSPLPKNIEVVIPNTPLSATEMYLINDASKHDLNKLHMNSKSSSEDSGVGESPSPPPPPPPPTRPEITSFVTTQAITLPNGEQLPAGATQLIVHPYDRTHPLSDRFTAEEFSKAYELSKKKSELNVQ